MQVKQKNHRCGAYPLKKESGMTGGGVSSSSSKSSDGDPNKSHKYVNFRNDTSITAKTFSNF